MILKLSIRAKRVAIARGRSSKHAQTGLTLIEFLIAMTLGLMIVAALTLLIAQQSATQTEFEKSSRQIENGRYALQILNDEIQLAGYYGEFFNVAALDTPGAMPDPCSTTVLNIDSAMKFAVQGYDSPASPAGLVSCIAAANHVPGTDILVIRRTDTTAMTPAVAASGAAGQIYLQAGTLPPEVGASGLIKVLGEGSDLPGTSVFNLERKGPSGPSFLRKFVVNIFFVSPCSVPVGANCSSAADGGNPIPTLKMVALTTVGGAAAFTTTPLVEGIENLQIDYGIDSLPAGAPPVVPQGDGTPDGQFVSTPPDLPSWANVVALRIHVLARNIETSPGYNDNKTYAMGYMNGASAQQVTPAPGTLGFKRRLFSQSIRLTNPSARRER